MSGQVEVIYMNPFYGGYEHCKGVFDTVDEAEAFIVSDIGTATMIDRRDYAILPHPTPYYEHYARKHGFDEEDE